MFDDVVGASTNTRGMRVDGRGGGAVTGALTSAERIQSRIRKPQQPKYLSPVPLCWLKT